MSNDHKDLHRVNTRFEAVANAILPIRSARRSFIRRLLGYESKSIGIGEFALPTRLKDSQIRFSNPSHPLVSILIPVYNHLDLTLNCLSSLAQANSDVQFEILVGDDNSSDSTPRVLQSVEGIRVFSNDTNLGFLRNVNSLAAHARGKYLILLNNDTLVLERWLEPLIEVLEKDDAVAIVGPTLLNKEGTVQDAGGIVYANGTAANFGRGAIPSSPEVSYARRVDYITGAVLGVRKEDFLSEFGAFDDRYSPGYYEDTDLGMSAIAAGRYAMFVPRSRVVHLEGGTHGRDPQKGVKAFQEKNRLKFLDKWKETLAAQHHWQGETSVLHSSRRLEGGAGTVLIVDDFPDWRHASGSLRLMGLVQELRQRDFSVVLIATSNPRESETLEVLSSMGVLVVLPGTNGVELAQQLSRQIAFMFVARATNAHFVTDFFSDAPFLGIPLVFDTVDLHFLRLQRQLKATNRLTHRGKVLAEKAELREREIIELSDLVTVVSEQEKAVILESQPEANVHVLSNVHRLHPIDFSRPGFEARDGLLFVANFQHPPNLDGIVWFIREVLPRIKRAETPLLRIVGANPPQFLKNLESKQLEVMGWVEDLTDLYQQSSVAIAPLRFGAGVKGKVSEAWAFGVPVVGTRMAFEGMIPPEDFHGGLVADSPHEKAKAICDLLEDFDFRKRRLLEVDKYRQSLGETAFSSAVDSLIAKLEINSDL